MSVEGDYPTGTLRRGVRGTQQRDSHDNGKLQLLYRNTEGIPPRTHGCCVRGVMLQRHNTILHPTALGGAWLLLLLILVVACCVNPGRTCTPPTCARRRRRRQRTCIDELTYPCNTKDLRTELLRTMRIIVEVRGNGLEPLPELLSGTRGVVGPSPTGTQSTRLCGHRNSHAHQVDAAESLRTWGGHR